jgi:hypothetical protein
MAAIEIRGWRRWGQQNQAKSGWTPGGGWEIGRSGVLLQHHYRNSKRAVEHEARPANMLTTKNDRELWTRKFQIFSAPMVEWQGKWKAEAKCASSLQIGIGHKPVRGKNSKLGEDFSL